MTRSESSSKTRRPAQQPTDDLSADATDDEAPIPQTDDPVTLTRKQFDELSSLPGIIADLQAQLQAMKSQSPTPNETQSPAPPQPKDVKIANPEFYYGDPLKLKAFIAQCQLNFNTMPSRFRIEKVKVNYALSFLRDQAFMRFQPLLSKCSPKLETFDGFVKTLESNFGDPNEAATATRRICALRQTASVSAYASEFMYYMQFLDWSDSGYRKQFFDGLSDAIKIELTRGPEPTNLEALIKEATQVDNRFTGLLSQVEPDLLPHFRPKPSSKKQNSSSYRPSLATAPSTVSTAPGAWQSTSRDSRSANPNASRPKYQPLTEAEKQYRREHNLCAYCGKSDHEYNACPTRPPRHRNNNPFASKTRGTFTAHASSEPPNQGKAQAQIR